MRWCYKCNTLLCNFFCCTLVLRNCTMSYISVWPLGPSMSSKAEIIHFSAKLSFGAERLRFMRTVLTWWTLVLWNLWFVLFNCDADSLTTDIKGKSLILIYEGSEMKGSGSELGGVCLLPSYAKRDVRPPFFRGFMKSKKWIAPRTSAQ
jgi:hypothetical protein